MRMIPTRLHGVLDYATGAFLIALPYLLGFADGTVAQVVPQALGVVILLVSLVTDYEHALADLIPVPMHLGIDILGGLILAASPWLFGFAGRLAWPHVTFGLVEVALAMLTRPACRNGPLLMRRA